MLLKIWILWKSNKTEERLREQFLIKQIHEHYKNQKLPDVGPTEEGFGNTVAEEDTNKDDILEELVGEIVESDGLKCELVSTKTTVVPPADGLGTKDSTERDDTKNFVTRDGDM